MTTQTLTISETETAVLSGSLLSERALCRKILGFILIGDSDLEAYCGDYFPEVNSRFTLGMDRVTKVNILLNYVSNTDLLSSLAQHAPDSFAKYAYLLSQPEIRPGNPYRGLSAFRKTDSRFFFGREDLTEKLRLHINRIFLKTEQARLLAVIGPSGCGKSSIVRAGLVPALLRRPLPGNENVQIVLFRPGVHPVESLAIELISREPVTRDIAFFQQVTELVKLLRTRCSTGDLTGLRLLTKVCFDSSVLLVIDQFEEIYAQCRDADERDNFVELLLHASCDPDRRVTVVLTLRSDFLGETLHRHPDLNRAIGNNAVVVPAMNEGELRRAISEPARLLGRELDGSTVELLVRDTRCGAGTLPLLQFALTCIWDGVESGRSPAQVLATIGGVGGAIAGCAQQILDSLASADRVRARRILMDLFEPGENGRDTRRRVRVSELTRGDETEQDILRVLRAFAGEHARLVTLSACEDTSENEPIAEVTHESLLQHWSTLQRWLAECRDELRFRRYLDVTARRWDGQGRAPGLLWRSPDLDQLREFVGRTETPLSTLQADFWRSSEQQQQDETQVKKRMQTYRRLAMVALVISSTTLLALLQVNNNRKIDRIQSKLLQEQQNTLWMQATCKGPVFELMASVTELCQYKSPCMNENIPNLIADADPTIWES